MDPIQALCHEIHCSVHGGAWHGPALLESLEDVDAAEAARHPVPGAHSILEIGFHALGWIEEVGRRLKSGHPELPERGDWPTGRKTSSGTWEKLPGLITEAAARLEAGVAAFPPERLDEVIGSVNPSLGTGVTYAAMLHGLAQHNAYHAGQIVILKRALGR
ncbi:MAG TPA: DinB family protein [Thermoanaerobaculia bacterium]|nr:DinB family protein [Thermoanaerobaculia bacterium]